MRNATIASSTSQTNPPAMQTRQTVEGTVVTVKSIFTGDKNASQIICRLAKKKLLAITH